MRTPDRPFIASIRGGEKAEADLERAGILLKNPRTLGLFGGIKLPNDWVLLSDLNVVLRERIKQLDLRVVLDLEISGGAIAAAEEAVEIIRRTPFKVVHVTLSRDALDEQIDAVSTAIVDDKPDKESESRKSDLGRKVGLILSSHFPETSPETIAKRQVDVMSDLFRTANIIVDHKLAGLFCGAGYAIAAIWDNPELMSKLSLLMCSGVNLNGETYGDKVNPDAVGTFKEAGANGISPTIGSVLDYKTDAEVLNYVIEAGARYAEGVNGATSTS